MTPDRATHVPPHQSAAYVQALMAKIGKSQVWVAEKTGISRRRLQYLLVGSREFNDELQTVALTYPEQWILECLAGA